MKTIGIVKEYFIKEKESEKELKVLFCTLTSASPYTVDIPDSIDGFSSSQSKSYNLFYNNYSSATNDMPEVKLLTKDTVFEVPNKFEDIIIELIDKNKKAEFEVQEIQNENEPKLKKKLKIVSIKLGV